MKTVIAASFVLLTVTGLPGQFRSARTEILQAPLYSARASVQVARLGGPAAREGSPMVYDAGRRRVVLFGGHSGGTPVGDMWEWDGRAWAERKPSPAPPRRAYHKMVYDAARQRVVLFGGATGNGVLGDLWEWNGIAWARRESRPAPPARVFHAMAYDVGHQRVVLFGGETEAGVLGDTWEWDGTQWAQKVTGRSPLPRARHAMVYDAARQRLVLFGGITETGLREVNLGDTWEWDGANWVERTPVTTPGPRSDHSMAYLATKARVLLFGGVREWQLLGDTWEWDGSRWVAWMRSGGPTARRAHAMANDSGISILVFGGQDEDGQIDDVWQWDGSRWTLRSLAGPRNEADPTSFRALRVAGIRTVLLSELRKLASVQERHFADHGRYAQTLGELGHVPVEGVKVTLMSVSDRGWAASAEHRDLPGVRCSIFVGDAPPPIPEVRAEGEPACAGLP